MTGATVLLLQMSLRFSTMQQRLFCVDRVNPPIHLSIFHYFSLGVAGSPPTAVEMGKVVVIFDFDRTLIDFDSDDWVVTEMGLSNLFHQLYRTMPWNSLMNRMMMELHSQGKMVKDITDCLNRAQVHSRVIAAIREAHSNGCDLKIISDANHFFIETILKHHGLLSCFSEIVTNPTIEDENGRLVIAPFHDINKPPHGCNLCPPNMCKGSVLDRILGSHPEIGSKRIVYLGDGKGDFCPSLKLRRGDFVMPRKDFPLWNCIYSSRDLIKPEVQEWSNGEELANVLLATISTLSAEA